MSAILFKQIYSSTLRLCVFIFLSIVCANYLNSKNYTDYFSRIMIKVHAESKLSLDAQLLSKLLIEKDYAKLQELLDRNYSVYALLITDCKTKQESCAGQKILFSTNPKLLWEKTINPQELTKYGYFVLSTPSISNTGHNMGKPGEIIGRVYSISTIPTFTEDYRAWLKNPFRDNEIWRKYLTTMASCLLGGFFFWIIMELFLKIRRIELKNAEQREQELIKDADNYLKQLEEKEYQLEERESRSHEQFEIYIAKIRDLEQKLLNVDEYKNIAETIIRELEEEKKQQSINFRQELEQTNLEKQSLQTEIERYKTASKKNKLEASKTLANVLTPQFSNVFEKKVFTHLSKSPKSKKREWIIINNFDVAAGRGGSQFIDCMVISKECLIVIEAKNYSGAIAAEGDVENSKWFCTDNKHKTMAVKSAWGENPYHQAREYSMSLLQLVQRSQWQLPVFGVVVFPEETDISRIDEKIGKYYRITTIDHLVGLLQHIEAEARRENAFSKRPSPEQIESLIRGRKSKPI